MRFNTTAKADSRPARLGFTDVQFPPRPASPPPQKAGRFFLLMGDPMRRSDLSTFARFAVLLGAAAARPGCEPLSITAAGVGGSAAVSHTLGGITYRTFTAPGTSVQAAAAGP